MTAATARLVPLDAEYDHSIFDCAPLACFYGTAACIADFVFAIGLYPLIWNPVIIVIQEFPLHICIIGGGIIGTTTAWELAQHGHTVTLLESREGVGLETSYANAGQLSYSYVAPLADSGVWADLPKWLLNTDSPLRFRPQFDGHQWRWCLAFLRACTSRAAQQTAKEMLSLSFLSRDTLAQWMAQQPMDFAWCESGKLVLYCNQALLEKAAKAVQAKGESTDEEILDTAACLQREPALTGFGTRLAGGIYAANSAVGDCHALSQALAETLKTMPTVELRIKAHVAAFEYSKNRIDAARLDNGERITAEHFILANALGARPLLRSLGGDLPLYGLKGYSLSLPLAEHQDMIAPQISVTDYERRIVYARIGNTLRIAAMVDIGDNDMQPYPARIALLKRQVAEIFPNWQLDAAQVWAGLRPATPDGKPRIGHSKVADNLWLNLGHGSLGFTLACGSAVVLRHLLEGIPAPIDSTPFQV